MERKAERIMSLIEELSMTMVDMTPEEAAEMRELCRGGLKNDTPLGRGLVEQVDLEARRIEAEPGLYGKRIDEK